MTDEIKIGKPTTHRPKGGGGPPVSERTKAIIHACRDLKPGEFLPVECADLTAAKRLATNARSKTTALGKARLRVSMRGSTVFFSKNGTH